MTREEAMTLLGISEVTELAVNEGYRALAKHAHPDAGGNMTDFLNLGVAKARLLQEAKQNKIAICCTECMGSGFVKVQRGFRAMRVVCPECKGTGDA